MTHWIIPSNNKFFRLDDLLKEHEIITWRQKNNFEAGDTIYIYSSSPQSRISYQMEVLRTGIPSSLCDTNEAFWVSAQRNRPYCALSEQQTIVEYLDTLKSKVARLQENYEKISQECDAMKQAILKQVFE